MKRLEIGILFLMSMILAAATARAEGNFTTVKGYVIDSACTFVKNLKKPISSECAVACAKAGSPLVILADDGVIYWPISAEVPAAGQNERLMPFAGQRVTVSGRVYQKGGSHAIVINKIERAARL
jgi:DNA/RNA endonuclease YhcR with UshA esterase domain